MLLKRLYPAEFIGIGISVFIGAAILYPVFERARKPHRHGGCQSPLKQIGLGLLQYASDYDDLLPHVATGGSAYGWADAIYPYTKSTRIYHCPSEVSQGQPDPRLSNYTDYWFNARLSGRDNTTTGEVARLLMAGDGNDGEDQTDARYSISALPAKWLRDPKSPPHRHLETANYLFADGHVKALKVASISTNWSRTKSFFTPKKLVSPPPSRP